MTKITRSFLKDSHFITDLKLCSIRLINNAKFPWVILIPRRKKITAIFQLKKKDQHLLIEEISHVSKVMKKIFKAFNLNVEKIGNIVPQLHIHIIARLKKDATWPLSVWVTKNRNYQEEKLNRILIKLKKILEKNS